MRTYYLRALVWCSVPVMAAAGIAGSILVAAPVGAGTDDPISVAQRMADRAKVIEVAMDGLSVADNYHYHLTRTLLSRYGGYTRFEGESYFDESGMMRERVGDTAENVADLRRDFSRTTTATANDKTQFEALVAAIEDLGAAALDAHDAVEADRIDEANLIYWKRADPAYQAVIRAAYTIRSNHGRAINIEALKLR